MSKIKMSLKGEYKNVLIVLIFLLWPNLSFSAELLTNAVYMADAPKWVTMTRVNKIADKVQSFMEWSIRRVNVIWYKDQKSFEASHSFGPLARAFARKNDNSIHLGPLVTQDNFDKILMHELVHIISYQKYKEAIPKWLEEGLANKVSNYEKVDYKWMATQPLPNNVLELIHPMRADRDQTRMHYMCSQAVLEMISAKCEFKNLLRLSVGRKMEDYLDTFCGIKDLNESFKKWMSDHKPK